MTEGIIQKVFRKYKDEYFEVDLSEVTILVISKEIVKDIEQELIKEIIQTLDGRYNDILPRLIGETKE